MYKNIPKNTISICVKQKSPVSGCNVLCTIEVQESQHTLAEHYCLNYLPSIEANDRVQSSCELHRDIIKGGIKKYQNNQKSSITSKPLVVRNA